MADYSPMMSQSEIAGLKDALSAQQRLLQKLYNELEAEREASATAASEALSVILRLQGEKAAVKMEAEQYKRLAEEKMCHAEESFAVIEDIITQKEMEMADLDYQLQTYKYQLMSYGLIEPEDDDVKIPDNLMHRNEGGSFPRFVRRNSAPLLIKTKSPEMGFGPKNVDDSVASDSERRAESSYADQIRELELRVIEIAGAKYESPSVSSQPSVGNLHETRPPSPQLSVLLDSKKANVREVDYPTSSSRVHDVFEVPQADDDDEPIGKEVVESYDKSEPHCFKKLLHSTHNLCKPSDIHRGEFQDRPDGSSEITEIQRVGELFTRDEEMQLLKEIREKLNLLQDEIRCRKEREPSTADEPSLCPLSEAMVYFWL